MIRPRAPAAMRIQPTTSMLTPPTRSSSAKVRIAPTAMRKMLAPMPIVALLPGGCLRPDYPGGRSSTVQHTNRPGGSANNLEVEHGGAQRAVEPHPDRQQHLGAAGGADVAEVDDIGVAEASQQLDGLRLGVRVVARDE